MKFRVMFAAMVVFVAGIMGCGVPQKPADASISLEDQVAEAETTSERALLETTIGNAEAVEDTESPIVIYAPETYMVEVGTRIKLASVYSLNAFAESNAGEIVGFYIVDVTINGNRQELFRGQYYDCEAVGEGGLTLIAYDDAGNEKTLQVMLQVVEKGAFDQFYEVPVEPSEDTAEGSEDETKPEETTKANEEQTKPPAAETTRGEGTTSAQVTTEPETTEEAPAEPPAIQGIPTSSRLYLGQIYQNPELPTGCESVALTMALNYYGCGLEKTTIARDYLVRHSSNYAIGFVGDPFGRGAGVFPPGLISTAKAYLSANDYSGSAYDLTGTSFTDLYRYIAGGTPVVMWTTNGFVSNPGFTGGSARYNGRTYRWYSKEHCVVLAGYDQAANTVTIYDPIYGVVVKDADLIRSLYEKTGMYAMILSGVRKNTPDPEPDLSTEISTESEATTPSETPEVPGSSETETPEVPGSSETETPEVPDSSETETSEVPGSSETETPEVPSSSETEAPEVTSPSETETSDSSESGA